MCVCGKGGYSSLRGWNRTKVDAEQHEEQPLSLAPVRRAVVAILARGCVVVQSDQQHRGASERTHEEVFSSRGERVRRHTKRWSEVEGSE